MDKIKLIHGDCIEELKKLSDNSIEAIVTDPPYHLKPIVKRFGKKGSAPPLHEGVYARSARGFMGTTWDGGNISFRAETWAEILRVAKPGAYLLAFGGTRTFHKIACAIEDSGWILKDVVIWMHSQGFPKSHEVSHRVDIMAGKTRKILGYRKGETTRQMSKGGIQSHSQFTAITKSDKGINTQAFIEKIGQITEPATKIAEEWEDYGNALKPAWEPIILAQKPIDEITASEAYRLTGWKRLYSKNGRWQWVGSSETDWEKSKIYKICEKYSLEWWNDDNDTTLRRYIYLRSWHPLIEGTNGKKVIIAKNKRVILKRWKYKDRKFKNIALNCIKWRCGALNIDASRIGNELHKIGGHDKNDDWSGGWSGNPDSFAKGRWPANLILSHSEECVKIGNKENSYSQNRWLDSASYFDGEGHQEGKKYTQEKINTYREIWACVPYCPSRMLDEQSGKTAPDKFAGYSDSGGASKFFYCPKVMPNERNAGLKEFNDTIQHRMHPDVDVLTGLNQDPRWGPKISKNAHPTLKPIKLMNYLCKLITPPGKTVLDPFMGSGSTGCAAIPEGFKFIGIEKEEEYYNVAQARIKWWSENPEALHDEISTVIKAEKEESKFCGKLFP